MIELKEVLNASVVLVAARVLTEEAEAVSFCRTWDAVVEPNVAIGPAGPVQSNRFVISRDRMDLTAGNDRVQAKIEYPGNDINGVAKACELMTSAIEETASPGPQTSYGCNIALTYEQRSGVPASAYLADKLFTSTVKEVGRVGRIEGGSAKLTFRCATDGRPLTVTLEPRHNDAETPLVFLSANYHINEGEVLPTRESMRNAMESLWNHVHAVIGGIDRQGETHA